MEKFNNIYIGLDISLTGTGMSAIGIRKDNTVVVLGTETIVTNASEDWFTRQNRIATEVYKFVFKYKPRRIIIENYAFGATNGREVLGEVHGVIMLKLFGEKYPQDRYKRIVAPKSLKKFVAGNSQATKREMVNGINKLLNLSLQLKDHNAADALGLAYIGYCIDHYEDIEQKLEKHQKEVLKNLLKKLEETDNG